MFNGLFTAVGLSLVFGSTTIQSYVCQPPTQASITAPADAASVTTGQTVQVSGAATASSTVTLKVDGQAVATQTADQNNYYATQTSFAGAGSHQLQIHVANQCGARDSAVTTVVAMPPVTPPTSGTGSSSNPARTAAGKNTNTSLGISASAGTPPTSEPDQTPVTAVAGNLTLRLNNNLDGTTTDKASVYLSGTTSQRATVKITIDGNEIAGNTLASVNFGFSIPLNVGKNVITVSAAAGSDTASTSLRITRTDAPTDASSSNQPAKPWYKTTPGKVVIAGSIFLTILIIIGLVVFL